MRVLIACEYSGIVREAFKAKGHDAWSCDLLDTEIPGNHIQGDVLDILNDGWDLMIAHPPCTYLSFAGNRALYSNYNERIKLVEQAFNFFMALYNAPIDKVCVENPRGWVTPYFRREDQVIQPYQFGDPERKRTCLWLKNLPFLMYTIINPAGIYPNKIHIRKTGSKKGQNYGSYFLNKVSGSHERSRTFPGIAQAMAEQWG